MSTRTPKAQTSRPRPIRTGVVKLAGDYAGTEAIVRLNPPFRTFELFKSNTRAALGQVILSWNLLDEHGETVPLEDDLIAATDEELAAFAMGYMELLQGATALPKPPETPSGTSTPSNT